MSDDLELVEYRTRPKGNSRHSGYARDPLDWYKEPAWAVEALLDVEAFDGIIWDPACGSGNIPDVCASRGMQAFGSDIADRAGGRFGRGDFLAPDLRPTAEHIISNPPYGLAEGFARKGLAVASGKVALLLRLNFLESVGRLALWRETPLARVWVFARRVSMPPGAVAVEAKGGYYAFAWFVWEHGHKGPPVIGWLP